MINKENYLEIKNELIPELGAPIRLWFEIANELGDYESLDALLDIDQEMTHALRTELHRVYTRLHPDVQQAVARWDTSLMQPRLTLIVNKPETS